MAFGESAKLTRLTHAHCDAFRYTTWSAVLADDGAAETHIPVLAETASR